MSQVLINESTLQDTANAIRGLNKKMTILPTGTTIIGKRWTSDTTTSSGGLSTAFRFIDYFPQDFNAAYMLIIPLNSNWSTTSSRMKFCTSVDGNSDELLIYGGYGVPYLIPYTGFNKTGYHGFTIYRYAQQAVFIPIDENFNPIIYDENIHVGLPSYTISYGTSTRNNRWHYPYPYLYKKENADLLYPRDFKENIGKIKMIEFPIPVLPNVDKNRIKNTIYKGSMDIRFLGFNKLEDLKMIIFTTSQSDCIFRISQDDAIIQTGFEEYGKGYRRLNRSVPSFAYSDDQQEYPALYDSNYTSLHLKDYRLYMVTAGSYTATYDTWNYGRNGTSMGDGVRAYFVY